MDTKTTQEHPESASLRSGDLLADVAFLADRAMKAGSCSFGGRRDTGSSSNSIVGIAYGLVKLEDQVMPCDQSDLDACERAYSKIPSHRKLFSTREAMKRARAALSPANVPDQPRE